MDWSNLDATQPDLATDSPVLLVIHGLNGHSDEACVLYAMKCANERGWRSVAMNHRGCGGTRLTSGWTYNGSYTGDVRMAVCNIRRRYPAAPIFAVGFSLGANLLVKYLGEEGKQGGRPLAGAVSVSNPWNFEGNPVGKGQGMGLLASIMNKFYSIALTTGIKVCIMPTCDCCAPVV
ncbi:unnamed protein product [Sphacelaria rigidula]